MTVRRTYLPLLASIVLEGYNKNENFKRLINKSLSMQNIIHSDFNWHYSHAELEEHRKYTHIDWMKKGRLKQVIKLTKKDEKRLMNSTKENLEVFGKELGKYSCWIISAWCTEDIVTEELRKSLLEKTTLNETEKLMDLLNIPLEDNFFKKEEYDLVVTRNIKKHIKKYEWISSRYGKLVPYTINEAKEKLKKINKKKFLDKWKKEKKEVKDTIKKTKNIIGKKKSILVDMMQFLVYYRTQRTDMYNKAVYFYILKLKEFAKKHDLSYKELLYCNFKETSKKLPSKELLKERMKNYVLILEDGDVKILIKEMASKVKDFLKEDLGNVNEIKGSIACKGKIKAKVKVVLSMDEFSKVQEGDVLVTSMTTPEFVPIMKKASAFVTDEGGITCHAAIVSREMKKPCIIGTKIATKILKDGDLVEVDANKGIVRKL